MPIKKKKLTDSENKRIEIIAIIALILFAIISMLIKDAFRNKDTARNISIYLNGKKIEEIDGVKIDINVDNTLTIGDLNSNYNIIEIKDKQIRCIDANCPDKICVQHGYLNRDIDNDIIACAPHRLLIK